MGHKSDRIVSLEKSVRDLTALRVSDNHKATALLAKERASHQEVTIGLTVAINNLQGILEALKGLVAKNEDVPPSFAQGLKDCDAGRVVDMEKALIEVPVTLEISTQELIKRYSGHLAPQKPIPPPNRLISESDGG